MAYIVGKDDKKKQDGMNVLGAPGSFQNIKSQLQGEQLQQAIQPQHAAPKQEEDEKRKKRGFAHGGVVQRFQEGGFPEEEDEVSITGQSKTGGGGYTGRGIGATAPQQRSGSFTGIQQYIEANKPKTAELSEAISSGFEKDAGDIRGAADKAQTEYDERQAGSEDFIGSEIDDAGTGYDTDYTGETPEETATREAQDAADAKRYSDIRTGADQGTNLQEQGYDANQLEQRAARLRGAGGRYAELQRIVGKTAGYSRGERQLDQLALAGDPQSRMEGIRRAREATQGLSTQVGGTAQG